MTSRRFAVSIPDCRIGVCRSERIAWPNRMHEYYVYIATNKSGTLYTGVTNNIRLRMHEHKTKAVPGFTS